MVPEPALVKEGKRLHLQDSNRRRRATIVHTFNVTLNKSPIKVSEGSSSAIILKSTIWGYQDDLQIVWVRNDIKLIIDNFNKRYKLQNKDRSLVLSPPIVYKHHDGMFKIVVYNAKREVVSASTQVIVERKRKGLRLGDLSLAKGRSLLSKYPPYITTGIVIFTANVIFLFICYCVQPKTESEQSERWLPAEALFEGPDLSDMEMDKHRIDMMDDYLEYENGDDYDQHYQNNGYHEFNDMPYDHSRGSGFTPYSTPSHYDDMSYQASSAYNQDHPQYTHGNAGYEYNSPQYDVDSLQYDKHEYEARYKPGYDPGYEAEYKPAATEYDNQANGYPSSNQYGYENYDGYYGDNNNPELGRQQ